MSADLSDGVLTNSEALAKVEAGQDHAPPVAFGDTRPVDTGQDLSSGKITIFHGDNDPYVPLSAAQKLSDKLETLLTIIKNGGHLNAESGYTKFPEILEIAV